MFDLDSYLIEKNDQVNTALDKMFLDSSGRIGKAMRYSLMAGGKRIRPVLCMAAAEAVGVCAEEVLPVASVIEMIHTYSLIHDDLPAMDNDDLRRGKPTCHLAFDEATAILAGDALVTLAFEVLSSLHGKYEPSQLLQVTHIIATAAGYKGMIEGQSKDIASEGLSLTLGELQALHLLKTGALIEASVCSGAILGQGTPEQIEDLKIYAKNIGLTFQITDDILNIEGDPDILGKGVGTDETRKKNTYPSIMGIEESKAFAKNMINKALQALNKFNTKADPLRAIANYIIERKK